MSNIPLDNSKNKFLITERSLNYILRPVRTRMNRYPYTYNVENMSENITVTVDRAWTPANHMILDFIGHQLWEHGYKKVSKKRTSWKNDLSQSMLRKAQDLTGYNGNDIPDNLKPYVQKYLEYAKYRRESYELADKFYRNEHDFDDQQCEQYDKRCQNVTKIMDEIRNEVGIHILDQLEALDLESFKSIEHHTYELKLSKLKERYSNYFNDRKGEYLLNLIKRTSETRFTMPYALRIPIMGENKDQENSVTKISGVGIDYVMIKNENFFNLKNDSNKILVSFDTLLGRAYVHNLLTLNTDWFEKDFLKLDGLAASIYRRFFVTKRGNKFAELSIKAMVDYFGLIENSRYPEIIKKAFEDIKNAGLINDYNFNANGGKFSKGYIEVVKSSK